MTNLLKDYEQQLLNQASKRPGLIVLDLSHLQSTASAGKLCTFDVAWVKGRRQACDVSSVRFEAWGARSSC